MIHCQSLFEYNIDASHMSPPPRFAYTDEIDDRIRELVKQHGKRWRTIANHLGNLITDDAVRNRYTRLVGISPKPCNSSRRKQCECRRHWTDEEDERLARAVETHGTKWDTICEIEFPDKTRQAIRNRAHRMGVKLLCLITAL